MVFTFQYYNGSAWVNIPNAVLSQIIDELNGELRLDFIIPNNSSNRTFVASNQQIQLLWGSTVIFSGLLEAFTATFTQITCTVYNNTFEVMQKRFITESFSSVAPSTILTAICSAAGMTAGTCNPAAGTPSTISMNFNGTDCLTALQNLAATCGVNCWNVGTTVNIGVKGNQTATNISVDTQSSVNFDRSKSGYTGVIIRSVNSTGQLITGSAGTVSGSSAYVIILNARTVMDANSLNALAAAYLQSLQATNSGCPLEADISQTATLNSGDLVAITNGADLGLSNAVTYAIYRITKSLTKSTVEIVPAAGAFINLMAMATTIGGTLSSLANATTQLNTQPVSSDQIVPLAISGSQVQQATITGGSSGNLAAGTVTGGSGGNIASGTVTGSNIASATITGANLQSATITATQIANATITGTQIASATITASNIQNATITSTQIASGTITGSNIASSTITGSNISSGTITGANIGSATITGSNIASGTITGGSGGNIGSATITGSNIASGTITGGSSGNIGSGTITATNIANATITSTQIASGTITGGNIASATITGSNIVSGTITGSNIGSATITNSNIASGTIIGGNIASATITGSNLVSGTITSTQIASGTITATQIANATITATQISGSANITGSQIASATITGGNIASATITGSNIASATIQGGNIAAGAVTGTIIAAGTITNSNIYANTIITNSVVTGLKSWTTNIAFSVHNWQQVNWAAGSVTTGDGTTYSIGAGNTGSMTAETYVYLDTSVSTTQLQKTTTYSSCIGDTRILVATCMYSADTTKGATFQVYGGSGTLGVGGAFITAAFIISGTITANEIAAGTITGSNIAASTITASNLNVSSLSAISANAGTLTSGTIVGATIETSSGVGGTTAGVLFNSSGITINASSTTSWLNFEYNGTTVAVIYYNGANGLTVGGTNPLSLVGTPIGFNTGTCSTPFVFYEQGTALFTITSTQVTIPEFVYISGYESTSYSGYEYVSGASGGAVAYNTDGSGTAYVSLETAGRIYSLGEIDVSSDQRLKTLIDYIDPAVALSAVEKLKPLHFQWRPEAKQGNLVTAGLFAQEVAKVIPESVMVFKGRYDDEHALNYDALIVYALAAIQKLSEEIKEIKQVLKERR